jgi:hypothetical protein
MQEHRLFIRYKVQGDVLIHQKTGELKPVKGDLVDLCFKGAGIYSKEKLEPEMPVRFIIMSKSFPEHIKGEGKIIYVRPMTRNGEDFFRLGLNFINVDSEQLRDILVHLQDELAKYLANNF